MFKRIITPFVMGASLLLAAGPAGAGETVRVVIDQYRFEPARVRVKTGDMVEWLNAEKRTSHSIKFEGEPESERLFPGDVFRKSFATPGTYRYVCGPHPEMTGIVDVVP